MVRGLSLDVENLGWSKKWSIYIWMERNSRALSMLGLLVTGWGNAVLERKMLVLSIHAIISPIPI